MTQVTSRTKSQILARRHKHETRLLCTSQHSSSGKRTSSATKHSICSNTMSANVQIPRHGHSSCWYQYPATPIVHISMEAPGNRRKEECFQLFGLHVNGGEQCTATKPRICANREEHGSSPPPLTHTHRRSSI